jgi:cytochrome P450
MTPIASPLQAVTHADPYPYYAELVATRPFGFDDGLGLFVAAGAGAVREVLAAPAGRVRPPAEPVPKGIVGTAAGDVFGRLVRMNDGDLHDRLKAVVTEALGSVPGPAPWGVAARRAQAYLAAPDPDGGAEPDFDALMFAVPSEVVAELCGLVVGDAEEAARLAGDFVKCLSPAATPEQLDEAASAAAALQELMGPQLEGDGAGLLRELVRAAARDEWHETAPILANGVGFLSQTYDATAGLIGNTLLALRNGPAPADLQPFVREVARWDSPVQTTRRFAAEAFEVDGTKVDEGQAVLLLLGAANRDPAANPEPDRFDPQRKDPVMFTFGAGGHGCPGETLAVEIACGVVGEVLASGFDAAAALPAEVAYRPSGNVRVPILHPERGA